MGVGEEGWRWDLQVGEEPAQCGVGVRVWGVESWRGEAEGRLVMGGGGEGSAWRGAGATW